MIESRPVAVAGFAAALRARIADRSATVAVIGLGYVGLTAACAAARAGYSVVGVDIDAHRVELINQGIFPIGGDEPNLPALMTDQVRAGRLTATTDHQQVANADIILLVVQTPVDTKSKQPDLSALISASSAVAGAVRPGTMVIVESTIPPGTMANLVSPILERISGLSAANDLLVCCCPERVMPGKLLANLESLSRVVGGMTPEAAAAGAAFYQTLTAGDVDETTCLAAEITKTAENAYRDVQIAFANELAMICEDLGADVYEVRDLINKTPFRNVHLPGAGVGGHCIPKDPWLLIANVRTDLPLRVIPGARAINDGMPHHLGQLVRAALSRHGRPLAQARVVALGYAYLENSDDARNSPTADLIRWLEAAGATVVVHDPLVPGYGIDLDKALAGADAAVLMVGHDAYRSIDLARLARTMRTPILVDGRHVHDAETARAAGLDYTCVGVGQASDRLP